MAPRSIWNGTITFGLVNVPIKLYSATESKTISFHEVHARDGARIEHRRICPKDGKEVPTTTTRQGLRGTREGKYVVLDKDEIKAAAGDRGKVDPPRPSSSTPPTSTRCSSRRPTTSARATTQDPYRAAARGAEQDRPRRHRPLHLPRSRVPGRACGRSTMCSRCTRCASTTRSSTRDELEIPSARASRRSARSRWRASSSTRCTRSSTRELRGQLPRGGARPDQAQGQGRGDRPRGAGGARAGRRPDGGARGERLGRALMARPLWSGSLSFGLVNVPGAAVQRGPRPRLPLPPAAREGQAAHRAAALLLGGGRRGRLGGGRDTLRPRRQAGRRDRRGARLGRAAQDAHDRDRVVRRRSRTSTRSTSTTPTSSSRPATRRHDAGLPAAGRGHGRRGPGRDRALRHAHQGVPGRGPGARRGA